MTAQILYRILIFDKNISPQYISSSGVIIDDFTGKIIFKLVEQQPFFYFRLEFDSYEYREIYQPKTDTYAKKILYRQYRLYLYINTKLIISLPYKTALYDKLAYHLIVVQRNNILFKKNYTCPETEIGLFVKSQPCIQLVPWKYLKIDQFWAFDLVQKKIVLDKRIPKINSVRRGGIIETNHVKQLLTDHFYHNFVKPLVVLPVNITNLWPKTTKMITYDQLVSIKKDGLDRLKKYCPQSLIIHECYIQFLPHLKKLVSALECKKIWIINSLPLTYYFSYGKKPIIKLSISELATLINLWLNFSDIQKKKYKLEIIRLLYTNFNQYYKIVNYPWLAKRQIIHLKLGPVEKYIIDLLNSKYASWKCKLTNESSNIYSTTTKSQTTKIESKIFESSIHLILSVVKESDIQSFFHKTNMDMLKQCTNYKDKLDRFLNFVQENISRTKNLDPKYEDDSESIIKSVKQKIDRNNSLIANCRRYLTSNVYQALDNESCPICYGSDEMAKTKLICGHIICLECILNALARYNKCPVCNEHMTTKKMVIVHESVKNYSSEIISYLTNLDNQTVVVTDLDALEIISGRFIVVNINNPNASTIIKNIKSIKQVVLFATPFNIISKKSKQYLENVINYFSLFNANLKFSQVVVAMN